MKWLFWISCSTIQWPFWCLGHHNLTTIALILFSWWLFGRRVIYFHYYYDEPCKINLYCLKRRNDDWWGGFSIHRRDCAVIFSHLQWALLTQNDDKYKILQSVKKKRLMCCLLKTDGKYKTALLKKEHRNETKKKLQVLS